MINPQWLELSMSRTNFHGPKDVRAIEVWLYFSYYFIKTYVVGTLSLCEIYGTPRHVRQKFVPADKNSKIFRYILIICLSNVRQTLKTFCILRFLKGTNNIMFPREIRKINFGFENLI